jgi:hypothetical protein
MTVVRLEIEPLVSVNGFFYRHIVGVGEEVICRTYPRSLFWSVVAFGLEIAPDAGNEVRFYCPYHAMSKAVNVCVDGKCCYMPELEVVEPSGVAVKAARELTYSAEETNVAGWAGMVLDLVLLPTNVCFSAIFVMEVPESDGGVPPTGYFANSVFSEIWHHTVARGAGVWHRVQRDNHFLDDYAECGEGLPQGWSVGKITWRIPVAWGYWYSAKGVYQSKQFGEPYYQFFIMDSHGNLRVKKFERYWVERTPDGIRRRSNLVN